MVKLVTHKFVSAIPDGDDATIVRPSNWNDTHDVSGVAESGANTDITSMTGITGGISSPDYIAFDTTYATPLTTGQLGWDGNNTLALGMYGGNVIQHIGEDSFFYIKASSAITKGQLVMFTGAVGASGILTGAPSTGIIDGSYIMGVAAEDTAHNAFGLVQCFGELTGVNTNGFNEGDILYYNSAVTGGLTSTYPTSGPIVQVAAVAKKSASGGVIVIRVSVTQRITAGTGASVSQTATGTSIAVSNPYDPAAVAITGGTINDTTIGATTPAAGTFTTITGQTEVLKGTGENLLVRSEDFSNASWGKTSVTVTANTTIAPDGTLTADTIAATATDSACFQGITTSSVGLTYTFSIYLKADVATNLSIAFYDTPSYSSTLVACAVTTSWQRFSVTRTLGSGSTGIQATIGGNSTFSTGESVYAWGAQVELGSTANTYIPTTTTAVYGTPTLSFSGVSEIGLLSNGALYLQPAGTGAIQAQATTSSTAGGNARGANAVDWQTLRGSAGQVASGLGSTIAGGNNNTAAGNYSTVSGGLSNQASGTATSVNGGQSNIAGTQAYSCVVNGKSNTSAGYFNFIGNGFTNSGTSASAVTTQATTTVTSGSTAVTLSGSNANIKVGQYITGTGIAADTYVAAISGTSLTLSQNANATGTPTLSFFTPHGVVVGGGNNQATGSYSFIGGGGDAGTSANRNVASGDWSFVGGGWRGTASGAGSFIGGGGTNGVDFGGNTASAAYSVVTGGFGNNSSATGATIVGGAQHIANASQSTILGGRRGTTRGIIGNAVFSACENPIADAQGINQSALLILGTQTTNATATILRSNSSAAGTTNQVILPNNSAYYFRGEIVAGVTGGGNTKGWYIEGVIKRGANAASTALVGTPTVTSNYADAGASTWAVAVTADTTNGGIKVEVTGQASTTIRWVAQIRTTEMTY